MDTNSRDNRDKRIMIVWLVILLILTIVFVSYIYVFNHTSREYDAGMESKDFQVSIEPRKGSTDSWQKAIDVDGEVLNYRGTIYDATVINTGDSIISNWTMRIDIESDTFLNNAWCGCFEVHQNCDGQEKVQTVDLRNYKPEDLELDYFIADPDLMIPLHRGDYLIYHPDIASKEYPINFSKTEEYPKVVYGMIFYYQGEEPIDFQVFHVNYYLEKSFVNSIYFWLLGLGYLLWSVWTVMLIIMKIRLREVHLRFKQDEHIISQSIGVFTRFFEAKDTYTNGHSQRVALYSEMIAQKLGLSEDERRKFYYIALMHDCGKCYIPDEILKKPGRLTDEEFEVIKLHTVRGAEMLEDFTSIDNIREGVLYHHERYDGKGYPEGLAGEDIPLVARIICVADSFDAMNSRRCYRNKLSTECILFELESNKGKQFDPKIAGILLDLIKEGKVYTQGENENQTIAKAE